ncbi:MAG: hypothetical protein WC538_08595 [Thermoanaerobaculia bacterium]|jgi:hypothetical protein
MGIADIAALINPTDERAGAVRELKAWIAVASELSQDALTEPEPAFEKLRSHLESIAPDKLYELLAIVEPPDVDQLFSELEDIRGAVVGSAAVPAAGDLSRRLISIRRKLDAVDAKLRLRRGLVLGGKLAAYLVPVAGAYLIGTYFRIRQAVYPAFESVRRPLAAYALAGENYSLTSEYRKSFIAEFSRHYFHRRSNFSQLFEPPSEVAPVSFRIVLRNPRNGETLLISTVEASGSIDAEPFPWSSVDVTPKIDVDVERDTIVLRDAGVGPSLNVHYKLSASGLVLLENTHKLFFNSSEAYSLFARSPSIVVLNTKSAASDELSDPVYWEREAGIPTSDAILQCGDGRVFEHVGNVTRLHQLTPLVRGGVARFELQYSSLREEQSQVSRNVALPPTAVYFSTTPALIERDDPCEPQLPMPVPVEPSPAYAAPSMLPSMDAFDSLVPVEQKLDAVSLVKTSLTIDFDGVEPLRTTASIVTPDELLKPAGYLIVDVNIWNPQNGTITLAISVNGNEVRRVRLPVLVPDTMSFNTFELASEIAKLKPSETPNSDSNGVGRD